MGRATREDAAASSGPHDGGLALSCSSSLYSAALGGGGSTEAKTPELFGCAAIVGQKSVTTNGYFDLGRRAYGGKGTKIVRS